MSLMERINRLEDQKWDLILQGAEVCPAKRIQFENINKKLNKLYAWLANGFMK